MVKKTCRVFFTVHSHFETILTDVDPENEKEVIETLRFAVGSMEGFGELKESWIEVDRIKEVTKK